MDTESLRHDICVPLLWGDDDNEPTTTWASLARSATGLSFILGDLSLLLPFSRPMMAWHDMSSLEL
jgi:hypothetical protein